MPRLIYGLAAAAVLLTAVIIIYRQDTNSLWETESPEDLHPDVRAGSEKLVKEAGKRGIRVIITHGFRSIEEQNRLYARGRENGGSIVTNARGGESLHNYGLAVDFALLDKQGNPLWDMEYDGNGNGRPDWYEAAEIAKDIGFEWGGDWQGFKDYPHLQMDFGLSLWQLQNGVYPARE